MRVQSNQDFEEYDCPGCGDKLKIPKTPASHTIITNQPPLSAKDIEDILDKRLSREPKEPPKEDKPPKEVKVKEYPSFMPGETCLDGNCQLEGVHKNKNYKMRPAKKCDNCGQFAPKGAKKCAWCKKEEFEDIEPDDLEELGIPLPVAAEGHEHHEGE